MGKERLLIIPISIVTSILFIILMVKILPQPMAEIVLDLGRGSWPLTVQNVMWVTFFMGLGELTIRWRAGWIETQQLRRQFLPEDGETVLKPGQDLIPIYKRVRASKYADSCFVPRLITRCILGFNLSHSADQTNSLLNSSLDLLMHEIDLRYGIVRYISWLIPSLGFIGTVVGIMLALNYAGDRANVESPDMLFQVTKLLGVAFATTLVGLVMSAILVLAHNLIQAREEKALNDAGQYCLDNLINRLYAP